MFQLLVSLDGVGRVRLEVAAVAGEDLLEVGRVDVVLEARRGGALVVAEVAGERLDLVVDSSHMFVEARLGSCPFRERFMNVYDLMELFE